MRRAILLHKTVIIIVLLLLRLAASGQVKVYGTVYDRSARFGMEGVSVKTNSGAGTVTDSFGRYNIWLPLDDSISFSYQGKSTQKFAVRELRRGRAFDMSIHVDIKTLPTVEVISKPHTPQLDSIENRNEYRKIFDFEREYLTSNGMGAGVNLDLLFGMKKAKRMEQFRRRLEAQERDKYVDYRFNRGLVKRITGLQSQALDTFMLQYRPSYEMLLWFENDYEYYKYIRDEGLYFSEMWRREHPLQGQ
ncbi:MAG TPA: hypothetical protein VGE90_07045 [Chitinophaga sp.]